MSVIQKAATFQNILKNMGWRYVSFRGWFEISKKTGILKSKFPQNPPLKKFISLEDWKKLPAQFFFDNKASLDFPKNPSKVLKEKVDRLRKGELAYFNAAYKNIGRDYDWLTNPDNGFRYDNKTHWLDVNDYSFEAGDIKYVWEKSRFSYFYTIIRYDYHFEEDCSEWIFSEIDNWIAANPINSGPNYKCSQEISLRLLNWLFALYYYKNSSALTEERFDKIMHYCYWQLHHVRHNINFSRIAVRNNHAITETMMLYLGGIFFPFFPEANKWSKAGLKWLEEEVAYQVYEDGTFLQFSHNYHRVLVQLLTWTLYLSDFNGKKLSDTFLSRSKKTLEYLYQCQLEENGHLPNYGANDGALFFPLNDCKYRDYRPQLNALAYYFNQTDLYGEGAWTEDRHWYNTSSLKTKNNSFNLQRTSTATFPKGGYYIQREKESLTFIRCGNHKDRPSHADNLHLDIWYLGKNMVRDAGTFMYNTTPEMLSFFMGTKGHNTVMLGGHDQMKKGARFIWLNWSQSNSAKIYQENDSTIFKGNIQAFQHLSKNISHERIWIKTHGKPMWKITDKVNHDLDLPIRQIWNLHPDFFNFLSIEAEDENGDSVAIIKEDHWFSEKYGVKEKSIACIFETKGRTIKTIIRAK